jgi:hypothetical protein
MKAQQKQQCFTSIELQAQSLPQYSSPKYPAMLMPFLKTQLLQSKVLCFIWRTLRNCGRRPSVISPSQTFYNTTFSRLLSAYLDRGRSQRSQCPTLLAGS